VYDQGGATNLPGQSDSDLGTAMVAVATWRGVKGPKEVSLPLRGRWTTPCRRWWRKSGICCNSPWSLEGTLPMRGQGMEQPSQTSPTT